MADLKVQPTNDAAPSKKRSLEELLSGSHQELSKVERRKLKKQRKKVLAGKGTRDDFYDIYGPDAKAELTLKLGEYLQRNRSQLKFTDIQGLILWILGEAVSPRWVFVSNKPLVEKVVVVMVDGLTQSTLTSHAAQLPCLTGQSAVLAPKLTPIPLEIPSSLYSPTSVLKAMLSCPLSRMNGIRKDKSGEPQEEAERPPTVKKSIPMVYAMSWTEMKTHGFPLPRPDGSLEPGFVQTKSLRAPSANQSDSEESDEGDEDEDIPRKIFAVDCEMCYTKAGLELTRVSLVDHLHQLLYDTLVKPDNPITDYNTRFSGLTEESMRGVTTTLADVQQRILQVVSSDDFLCGHSLENDLMALKIVHLRTIDTSLLYPHPRGLPYKSALRHLTKRWLGREIQTSKVGGHDSAEDAKAALELVQLKLKYGPQWGIDQAQADNFMSVLARYRRAIDVSASADFLTDATLFPPIVSAHQGATDAVRVDNAIQALKKKNDLVMVCLHEMMIALNREPVAETPVAPSTEPAHQSKKKRKQRHATPAPAPAPTPPSSPGFSVDSTNAELERLFNACTPNTMVIIVSGQTAAGAIRRMQMRKVKALQKSPGEVWSPDDDVALKTLLDAQSEGVALVAVK